MHTLAPSLHGAAGFPLQKYSKFFDYAPTIPTYLLAQTSVVTNFNLLRSLKLGGASEKLKTSFGFSLGLH